METLGSILMVNFHLNLIIFLKYLPVNPIVYWTFNELNGSAVRDDLAAKPWFFTMKIISRLLIYLTTPRQEKMALLFGLMNQTIKLEQDVSTYNIQARSAYVFGLNPRT